MFQETVQIHQPVVFYMIQQSRSFCIDVTNGAVLMMRGATDDRPILSFRKTN